MPDVTYFEHERLDVYKAALEFAIEMDAVAEGLPKGRAYLADQLHRASTSILFNIAEGSGEHSNTEKGRFYRMARRSATECAGILEICKRLQLVGEPHYAKGRGLLLRIVSMLTRMVRGTSYAPTPEEHMLIGAAEELKPL